MLLCAGTAGAKRAGASTKEYSAEFTLLLRSSANRCSSWHTSVFLNIFPARAVALSPLHSTGGWGGKGSKSVLRVVCVVPESGLYLGKSLNALEMGRAFVMASRMCGYRFAVALLLPFHH